MKGLTGYELNAQGYLSVGRFKPLKVGAGGGGGGGGGGAPLKEFGVHSQCAETQGQIAGRVENDGGGAGSGEKRAVFQALPFPPPPPPPRSFFARPSFPGSPTMPNCIPWDGMNDLVNVPVPKLRL